MDATKEMIDRLIGVGRELEIPHVIELDGRKYIANVEMSEVKEPTPTALSVCTLTGLVEYVKKNFDGISQPVIIINAPGSVSVISELQGPFKQRHCYLRAENVNHCKFTFGQYVDLEQFIIALQSQFVQDQVTAAILKLVGNVKDEKVMSWEDDGTTQAVKARAGIALVKEVPVPNPVSLKPYRTFLEVDQPESLYVFRLKSGDGAPKCSLHDADGGKWKLEAIQSIRQYLSEAMPEVTILA